MIKCIDVYARPVYLGTPQRLAALIDWCRSFLSVAFGAQEGERRLYKLSAVQAFELWAEEAPNVLSMEWAR